MRSAKFVMRLIFSDMLFSFAVMAITYKLPGDVRGTYYTSAKGMIAKPITKLIQPVFLECVYIFHVRYYTKQSWLDIHFPN